MQTSMAAGRFRVGRVPFSENARLVTDTHRSESFWLYRPYTWTHLLSGHVDARWYFRPMGDFGNTPVSPDYPSAEACLAGLAAAQGRKDSTDETA